MRKRKYGIFSLDVASISSGWSFSIKDKVVEYGIIKVNPKLKKGKRLLIFREELSGLLKKYKPSYFVIENSFSLFNIKTLKVLCEFSGVAKECCRNIAKIEPYVMSNKTPKAHFGVKTKEELFDKIIYVYGWEEKEFEFNKHNDITDAIAQSVCYFEKVLGGHKRKK